MIGQTVSHYRVIEKLGGGGMGVVYKAEDTKLHRFVALKFLPEELSRDRHALERFEREAQAASALNHPNICTIHDIDEHEGRHFIAMEFLEGNTLKHRIQGKPLGTDEILDLAIQISDGLDAAHSKGIIHRDIKPANIFITDRGTAKILDFGLAKLAPASVQGGEPATATATTETAEAMLTSPGTAVGTVAYMSPEQALGKDLDTRTDLFSFGAVLYEMATGMLPFRGTTSAATFNAILNSAPTAPVRINPDLPADLERIINKALEKDRDVRYQVASEIRADLKRLKRDSESGKSPTSPTMRATASGRFKIGYWIAAAALVVVGAGIWAFLQFFPREAALPPPRFVPVTTSGGDSPALSPDGKWIAYQWNGEKQDNWDIYVKEVDGPGFNHLTTDAADDCCPAWSPDSRQIAFLRSSGDRRILYLISPLGGGERKLTEVRSGPPSWSPDGKHIAFVDRNSPNDPWSIWSLSIDTLERSKLTAPPLEAWDESPAFALNGCLLAFIRRIESARSTLYITCLPGGEPKLLTDYSSPVSLCWTADSRELVYSSFWEAGEEALWRISVNGGEPRRVPARGERVSQPSVSGSRMAYVSDTGNWDIWRMELTGKEAMTPPSKPLLSWSSDEIHPVISPDGHRIAFTSNSSGSSEVWACESDGTKPVRLTDMKAKSVGSPSWSPDGKLIAFDSIRGGNLDIYVVGADGGLVRRITTDPAEEGAPRWSRDGRWIYYFWARGGTNPIWKLPPEGGKPTQVTERDGFVTRESADGYLYFNSPSRQARQGVWRVPVSGGSETLVTEAMGVSWLWDLADRGIYAIDRNAKPVPTICFYDFATQRVRSLGSTHRVPGFSVNLEALSVSPDRRWLVYSGGIFTSNIMMIDNFR
jgi:Tol biopolymer transport system component/tRNA A-37 threonylcarbamoyl transferase component Bud32